MLGTLLGAGGSFLGGLLDGDGGVGDVNRYNMMLNRDIRNMFREMGQRESLYYRDATGLFNQRLEDVMGTLDRAEAQVGQGTRSALRNAGEQSQQAQASVQQNLRSRGLGSSSIAGNAQRGIASDLARNVGDIYAQEGRTRAGLGQARAGLQSSLMGDIANLPLRRNASAQNRLLNYTGALENMAAVPSGQTGGFGDLFGGIGGTLGDYFGKEGQSLGNFWDNLF